MAGTLAMVHRLFVCEADVHVPLTVTAARVDELRLLLRVEVGMSSDGEWQGAEQSSLSVSLRRFDAAVTRVRARGKAAPAPAVGSALAGWTWLELMARELPSTESFSHDLVLHLAPDASGVVAEVSGSLTCFGHPDWGSQTLQVRIPVRVEVQGSLECGPAAYDLSGEPTDADLEDDPLAGNWSVDVEVGERPGHECVHWPCLGYEA